MKNTTEYKDFSLSTEYRDRDFSISVGVSVHSCEKSRDFESCATSLLFTLGFYFLSTVFVSLGTDGCSVGRCLDEPPYLKFLLYIFIVAGI